MRDYRPRSSYESDNVPWSKAVARRRCAREPDQSCGRAIKFQSTADETLTLLIQLNERETNRLRDERHRRERVAQMRSLALTLRDQEIMILTDHPVADYHKLADKAARN